MKFLLSLFLGAVAFASAQDMDIPSTAIAAGSFETLVAALSAAELVQTLSVPNGPYTVFAPTDDAFGALPAGLVDCLVKPENKDVLTGILTYHVVNGEVLSSALTDGMMAPTLNGANVTFDLTAGVMVGTATVTSADVMTMNGVIHIIDSVLVPPGVDVAAFLETCTPAMVDIPATAIAAGSFETLVAALGAAELVSTLSAPNGPYTVFAPSDDAFSMLPDGLVDCLVKPENKAVLTGILTYHVVDGEVLSSALTDGMMAPTLNGANVTFDLTSGVMVNTATVTSADVMTSNGVIHIIDSVLVPPGVDVAAFLETCTPAMVDIPATAVAAGTFETLVAALGAAELVGTLSDPNGPYTVFAPTDDAFGALPAGLVDCLVMPENKDVLTGILTYHVVDGEVLSSALTDGMMAPTLSGADVTIDLTSGVMVNTATVTSADVMTSNGVIHIIDGVLVPPGVDVTAFLAACTAEDPSPTEAPVDDSGASSLGLSGLAIASAVAFFAL